LSNDNEQYQRGLIITDDVAINPILDFNLYRNAIVNIIRNSYPKFTIGIFGDWGTDKSTLMNSIDKKLQHEDKDLVTVRFDTWRYERENQFALIPLLKTIEFSIPEERYGNLKDAFKEAGIFGIRISKDFFSGLVTNHLGKMAGDLFKKGLDDFSEKVIPELKKVNEIEKNTIYFDGQKNRKCN
jgi:predicted KAP-like P-loop ATPase